LKHNIWGRGAEGTKRGGREKREMEEEEEEDACLHVADIMKHY